MKYCIIFLLVLSSLISVKAQSCITLSQPSQLTLICTKTDVTTNGGNDGTAAVSTSGGTLPYTYLWSNGGTNSGIINLTTGSYSVTVTDANGCTSACNSAVYEPGCTIPTIGTNTPLEGSCTNMIPNDDAKVTFSGIANATKADKVIGSTYGILAPNFGSASNADASTGNLQFTGLKHNTAYTFRFWNGNANCFTDITITTPNKICPCPTTNCGTISVRKL